MPGNDGRDPDQPASAPSRSKTEQHQREATALRENLRRRKQQIQARAAALDKPMTPSGGDTPDG